MTAVRGENLRSLIVTAFIDSLKTAAIIIKPAQSQSIYTISSYQTECTISKHAIPFVSA